MSSFIIHNNNKIYIESRINPEREAERYISNINFNSTNIIILFGLTTQSFLKKLIYKLKEIKKKIYILSVDFDNQLLTILKNHGESKEILSYSYLIFFNKENINNISDFLEYIYYKENIIPPKYQIIKNVNLYRYFKNFYDNVEINISDTFKQLYNNILITDKFKHIWLYNIFKNINHIKTKNNRYTIKSFNNFYKNKPVLIINAGPSLDMQIPLIKEIKDNFYLISVDTALRNLIRNNIIPDFVISLDSQSENYLDFYNINTSKLSLIAEVTSNHKIIEKFKGNIFLFYTTKLIYDPIQEKKVEFTEPHYRLFSEQFKNSVGLQTGGSVSTTALDFALYSGFSPIVFIAQDLSFINYKIYCKNTYVDLKKLQVINKLFNYDSIISSYIFSQIIKEYKKLDNKIIISSFILNKYRDWLNDAFKILQKRAYIYEPFFKTDNKINYKELKSFPELEKAYPDFNFLIENNDFNLTDELKNKINNFLNFNNSEKFKKFLEAL